MPLLFFGQTKPININIVSLTSIDSIPEERKFTLQYSITNLTNNEVSFFLQPEKLFAAHTNAMGTGVFYKLFQGKDELIINGVFSTKKFRNIDGFVDFSNMKNSPEKEKAIQNYFEENMKKEIDSIEKMSRNIDTEYETLKNNVSRKLMNSVYTLQPNETKTYTTIWYWDKKRYFKRDEFEYYLNEKGSFYLQFNLFLMKEQYQDKLTKVDYEAILKMPNFIKGVFQSEKVEINFKE